MQYRDEAHAVARALNAGEGRPVPAKWQQQYMAGYRETPADETDFLSGMEKLLADSMANATIRRALTAEQYSVLVLRYAGNERERITALRALAQAVGTNAGATCRLMAIGAWAGYQSALPTHTNYDQQRAAESTIRGWRWQIKKALDKMHADAMGRLGEVLKASGLIRVD
jgi:hypothetical protein